VLANQTFPILLQKNGVLVVLVQNVVLDVITLRFHEVACPADHWHEVISSNDLCFHGALGVELLLGGSYDGKTASQR
jgi:hypothetical protein